MFFKNYLNKKKRSRFKAKPFVYRIDLVKPRYRYKRWNFRFVTLRLVKFFYSILSYKHFRLMSRLAKKKVGLYEQNYLFFLEGRLINYLYRTGVFDTIFKSFFFIRSGFVTINKIIKTHVIL